MVGKQKDVYPPYKTTKLKGKWWANKKTFTHPTKRLIID
jgi:hypothetical protein